MAVVRAGGGRSFACLSPKFLAAGNFVNILVQSSPVAIVAVGMTFVLLTAGIDLSVGSVMFLAGAVGGSLVVRWRLADRRRVAGDGGRGAGVRRGQRVAGHAAAAVSVHRHAGHAVHRPRTGLWITETRAINLPETFLQLAAAPVGCGSRCPFGSWPASSRRPNSR